MTRLDVERNDDHDEAAAREFPERLPAFRYADRGRLQRRRRAAPAAALGTRHPRGRRRATTRTSCPRKAATRAARCPGPAKGCAPPAGRCSTNSTLRSSRRPRRWSDPDGSPWRCGSFQASTRPMLVSSSWRNPPAFVPGGGRRDRGGVVEDRREQRQRAVAVVHHLDQPALLGPVDVRRGVDLPEARSGPCGTGRRGWRACGRRRRRSRSGTSGTGRARSSRRPARGAAASSGAGRRRSPASAGVHGPACSSVRVLLIVPSVWWP